jgi:subtilisin family serine protease
MDSPGLREQCGEAPAPGAKCYAVCGKRLGGGVVAILGGLLMLASQVLFVAKRSPLDLPDIGLSALGIVSGVVYLTAGGHGAAVRGVIAGAGVFALLGWRFYQIHQWLRTAGHFGGWMWVLENGGALWMTGVVLVMVAFTRAFVTFLRRR